MPDMRALVERLVRQANLAGPLEEEVIRELTDHLQDRFDDLLQQGLGEAEAYQKLLDEVPDDPEFQESLRRRQSRVAAAPPQWGVELRRRERWGMLVGLRHDIRIALRGLFLKPGFSLLVIGMLGLGIGANSAMFSVFNALFLRPWPFANLERLVDLDETAPKWDLKFVGISSRDLTEWRAENQSFEDMAFYSDNGVTLATPGGESMRLDAAQVTFSMLDVLGLKPAIGRMYTAEEDKPKGPSVALLAYSLWKERFGGDPSVLGRQVKLNGQPYTIIGVLPREAVVPPRANLWAPLRPDPTNGGSWSFNGVGKLKPGVTLEQARGDLTRVHRGQVARGRKENAITSPVMSPLRERFFGDFRSGTNLMLAAVGILMLIACVNVAGLMMVRSASRSREIAIRAAMGAGRSAIIRQLLAESVVLAIFGGLIGTVLGVVALEGLAHYLSDTLLPWITFALDWRSVLFAVLVTGGAAVVFGLLPAIEASKVDARASLQEGSRSSWSKGKQRALTPLMAGEVALAVILLVCSALVVRSFRNITNVDPGFRPNNLLAFRAYLSSTSYPQKEQRRVFFEQYVEQLRAVPGIEAVGGASSVPVAEHQGWFAQVEGGWKPADGEKNPVVLRVETMPGYLEAMGTTLIAGRMLEARDAAPESATNAVINESFAKLYWPNADPLGKRLQFNGDELKWMTVVGVTRDMRHYGLDRPARPTVFAPNKLASNNSMSIVIRTVRDPSQGISTARELLRKMDPEVPMANIRPMAERFDRALWFRKAYSWLITVLAALSTFLAAAGLYGVIAYAVVQRTREIGIRMALGAKPGEVMIGVLQRGFLITVAGAVAGMAAAWGIERFLKSLLFGVEIHDLLTYVLVVLVIVPVGALAGLIPARRAASVDPVRAMRAE